MNPFNHSQQGQGTAGGMNLGGMNLGGGAGTNATANAGASKQDPVDKAVNFMSQKAGKPMNRSTEEKITDAGRKVLEKVTGKHVNPKISN